jgi:ankyrin repeat protein
MRAQKSSRPPDLIVAAQDGETALHCAAKCGHAAIVSRLLSLSQVNANATDKKGDTALHIAASKGHTSVVQKLLESKEVEATRKNKVRLFARAYGFDCSDQLA